MHRAAVLLIVTLAAITAFAAGTTQPKEGSRRHDDPLDTYEVVEIQGWTVRVSGRYADHPDVKQAVLDEVRAQLRRITLIVQPEPLAELRKVEIWVEYDYPGRAQYHPSRDWLVANGYIAEKGKTIEIASAAGFLSWQARPVMTLLHELAHAYHDRVLGHGDKRVPEAYARACESGKFDSVVRDNGNVIRHYALTNDKEYFAECTEAYLWVNDYFPFVYGELAEADPAMAKLLREIWGARR